MYNFEEVKKAIIDNTAEILPIKEEELDKEIQFLVDTANQNNQRIKHYIGFEISGKVHLGTGIIAMMKIAKLQQAGIKCTLFLASYHTLINKKLDGKKDTIIKVSREYFAQMMIECLKLAGGKPQELDLVFSDEAYFKHKKNDLYFWDIDLEVGMNLTLNRTMKSITIMGKKEGEKVNFGTLRYPAMQVADCFWLNAHLVHAGIDQRKAHVLMREVALNLSDETSLKIADKTIKPIAIHHNLILGLGIDANEVAKRMTTDFEVNEELKMSKSKQNSAIWVHDTTEEIRRKIKMAYCPPVDTNLTLEENLQKQKFNPLLDWCKKMIFPLNLDLNLLRPEKFGGNKTYTNYNDLEKDYLANLVHPLDLKNAVADCLILFLVPIRNFVNQNPKGLQFLENVLNRKK